MSSRKHRRSSHEDDEDRHHRKKSKSRDIEPISSDSYFEKSSEFRLWLNEERDIRFSDLDSKESRHYFKKFVKYWNRGELDDKYYQGISSARLSAADNTGYKWAFAKKLDQHELDTVRDSVDTATDAGSSKGKRRNVGPALPFASYSGSSSKYDQAELEDKLEQERKARKYEKKLERQRREDYLDEVAPKETGREAQLAKRRAMNAYHKRERSPDVELSEADIYGGGDSFEASLAAAKRNEERRERRRAEREQQRLAPIKDKMAEYRAKESATIEMFKKMAEEQKKRGGL